MDSAVKKSDSSTLLLSILCVHGVFIHLWPLQQFGNLDLYIQVLCCLLILGIVYLKYRLRPKYRKLNYSLLFLSISYSISTYKVWHDKTGVDLMSPYYSIMQYLKIIAFILLVEYLVESGKQFRFVKYTTAIIGLYAIPCSLYYFSQKPGDSYFETLIGDKFLTFYALIFFVSLYAQYNSIPKSKFRIYIILTAILAYFSAASTIAVISGVIFMLTFASDKLIGKITKPSLITLSLPTIDILFFVFVSAILLIPAIAYFVVNVLHEDLTMNTRTLIWQELLLILDERILWGFGPGNETSVFKCLLNSTNAQNGILHLYFGIGIIGVCLFLYLFYRILCCVQRRESRYLLFFIIALIVASTIEVTFNSEFICYAAAMILFNKDSQNVPK